jgi:hypothetical protein
MFNTIKRWIPIIRYNLAHTLHLSIHFSSKYNFKYYLDICKCCGGRIVMDVDGPIFGWGCSVQQFRSACTAESCFALNCPLKTIPKFRNQLQLYRKYILQSILEIIQHYGYCVTRGSSEIELSLKPLRKNKVLRIYSTRQLLIIYKSVSKK